MRASVLSRKFVVTKRAAMRRPGKAREASTSGICARRATQPGGMQRRPTVDELLTQDARWTTFESLRSWRGEARRSLPTSCCPRCASSAAGTSKSRTASSDGKAAIYRF
jgi:hypothetical protein